MTLSGFVIGYKTVEGGTESLETASDGAFTASSIASISALSCLASAAASDLGAGFYMSTHSASDRLISRIDDFQVKNMFRYLSRTAESMFLEIFGSKICFDTFL